MKSIIKEKLKESSISILPIGIIMVLLHFTTSPMPSSTFVLFLIGMALLIIGMSLFSIGSDVAIMPLGEIIGSKLVGARKLWILIVGALILGISVTVAEPDLTVLAKQVPSIPSSVLIITVAVGVGVFLVLSLLRIIFQWKIRTLIIISYILVFIVASITDPDFVALGFDSGGVTTGPITVPFILALGLGVAQIRGGASSKDDSFGLSGIASIGPILVVVLLGLFYKSDNINTGIEKTMNANGFIEIIILYGKSFFDSLFEVFIALLPISLIFYIMQVVKLKLPKSQLIKITFGLAYTLFGLALFLTGVNIGFMPAGRLIGETIGSLSYNWILLPISVIIGMCVVAAEPAVNVLNKQIEDITLGAIPRKLMMVGLSISVGSALLISMIRIILNISIWYFLIPGYVIALILTFFVPKIFTAIAFDSGGIASGTMAAAFLLPFAVGVSSAVGANPMQSAFGIIAMVAMMPLVTVQIIGLLYQLKVRKTDNNDDEDNLEIITNVEEENEG